jgi:GNAT superfamily N-acetyltransferase
LSTAELDLRVLGYDHPDAERLIAELQGEYVHRYGGEDSAPVDPAQFALPDGLFLVGYVQGVPVAMGGWRRHGTEHPDTAWTGGAAEVKRMYVAPGARGHGFARAVLSRLESTAADTGAGWLLLETGSRQPEAIALYRSSGYLDVPAFGHYAEAELSVHLGKPLSERAPRRPGDGTVSRSGSLAQQTKTP